VPPLHPFNGFELYGEGRRRGGRGWLHFLSQRYVCDECLPDPWKDNGKAGKEAAKRIEQLNETEREREQATSSYARAQGG
jgi:hypothetical protein